MKLKLWIVAAAALLMIPAGLASARPASPAAAAAVELGDSGVELAQHRGGRAARGGGGFRGGGHAFRGGGHAYRGGAFRGGPRMGVAPRAMRPIGRPIARPGGVVRPGFAGRGVRHAYPGRYRPFHAHLHRPYRTRYWRPGYGWVFGSVVAVGFLSAAAAMAYAPPPPAEGLCWFYTDPTYRAGYWALCQ